MDERTTNPRLDWHARALQDLVTGELTRIDTLDDDNMDAVDRTEQAQLVILEVERAVESERPI